MTIKAKEFKFKGNAISHCPMEYTINWDKYLTGSIVTITRAPALGALSEGYLRITGSDIPKFIKELQTLMEFMKNDGLLVENEEEEEENIDGK